MKAASYKKSILAASVLLLLCSIQAHAGSVTLQGQVDMIMDSYGDPVPPGTPVTLDSGVTYDSPVTLELTWAYDPLVPDVGEATVTFKSSSNNTMTLTIGDMVIRDTPSYGFAGTTYPVGHFTDGELDFFSMGYTDIDIENFAYLVLSCSITGDARQGDTQLSIQIIDENSTTGDWFYASVNFPSAGPGLPPEDADQDYDVDGQDLALLASATGAELQALAGSFGQIL